MSNRTSPDKVVRCVMCSKTYGEVYQGSAANGQGYGCACEISGDIIRGHYGSIKHDMRVYRSPHITGLPLCGTACDDCVDELIEAGATLISSSEW